MNLAKGRRQRCRPVAGTSAGIPGHAIHTTLPYRHLRQWGTVAARPKTKTMNQRPNMFAQNDAPLSVHSRAELPDDQLRALAPSVFAAQPIPGVSSRCSFVPTAQLVSRLREAGWSPVSAVEQRIKIEERLGFQKHLIRFQRRDVVPVKGEYTPELCLTNSHDRSSAYQLHAGLYRFICANGMFFRFANSQSSVSRLFQISLL